METEGVQNHNLSKNTMLHASRTLVMLVLLYGAGTWDVSSLDPRKLKMFQMRCLRDILGVTLWDRTWNMHYHSGENWGVAQLQQRRFLWFGHVWRMPAHRPQRQLMWCKPSRKKRLPGGAPLRWCDLIKNNLRGMTNRKEAIQDRNSGRFAGCLYVA